MSPLDLQRMQLPTPGVGDDRPSLPTPRQRPTGFSNAFEEAVNKVDDAQKAADTQVEAFVAGEQENLHEVMIAMNEASLSFQMMTEVRNRAIETYQELMRMQV